MKREAAHSKLALLPDGSFVVRRNPENGQYALSVRYSMLYSSTFGRCLIVLISG